MVPKVLFLALCLFVFPVVLIASKLLIRYEMGRISRSLGAQFSVPELWQKVIHRILLVFSWLIWLTLLYRLAVLFFEFLQLRLRLVFEKLGFAMSSGATHVLQWGVQKAATRRRDANP